MLIRELERKTGLDRATIRFYEKEGLITPERDDGVIRKIKYHNKWKDIFYCEPVTSQCMTYDGCVYRGRCTEWNDDT